MIFRKYDIVILKEGKSGSHSFHIYGWVLVLCVLSFITLAALNIWLWQEWLTDRQLEDRLLQAGKVIADQKRQTVALAEKITTLSQDMERIQKFDLKLRLMMNIEKDLTDVGDFPGDFSRTYLPLHRQELAARKMQEFLDRLSEATRLEEVRQQELLQALRKNHNVLASMPSIWPVTGFVSSSFGTRNSPFGRGAQFHKGLDISNRIGTPIIAPADGTVILGGPDGAYGNSVEVDHGGGIVTKFAHMQKVNVKPGQWVKRGETIGYVGMTGRATGPHLHYEVHLNGVPVNPMRYILD